MVVLLRHSHFAESLPVQGNDASIVSHGHDPSALSDDEESEESEGDIAYEDEEAVISENI